MKLLSQNGRSILKHSSQRARRRLNGFFVKLLRLN